MTIIRQQALVEGQKKVLAIESELAPIEDDIVRERGVVNELGRQIAALAVRAAHDDRGALKQQRKLREEKEEHALQVENLEASVVDLRIELTAAQTALTPLERAATREAILNEIPVVCALASRLTQIVAPVAKEFGEFRVRMDGVPLNAMAMISRGDVTRIRSLQNRLRTACVRGILAQLNFDFRSVGLELFEVSKFEGPNFPAVVTPVLETIADALEVDLIDVEQSSGRARFRCLTNISGLLGLTLHAGEMVSLPIDHVDVQKMLELGALEEIVDGVPTPEEEESL